MGPISRLVLFIVGGAIEFVCALIGWTALTSSLQLFSSSHQWLILLAIPSIVFSGLFCLAAAFAIVFLFVIVFDFSGQPSKHTPVVCI